MFVDEFRIRAPPSSHLPELAELAEASTWVGDPKQALYGFRNADTALTQAAFTV